MDGNPLLRLRARGQSVWLDDIHRRMLDDGALARMIEADGLRGLTSNPAIFANAIMKHAEYRPIVAGLLPRVAHGVALYESIVIDDIRRAADLFRAVHGRTAGADGFVSLEVSPHLAHQSEPTVSEGRRLWDRLERANVMIKVPGTRAGLAAVRALIAAGVNVNVTLLFSPARYRQVADAYLSGLEQRVQRGAEIRNVASVASFFLSRIDTLVDRLLDEHAGQGRGEARALRGRTATALAAQAYEHYGEIVASARWRDLASRGARPQRLLWASTSTKDPRYGDVKYIEDLIAPETVSTMPLETLAAYRDHGKGGAGLAAYQAEIPRVMRAFAALGIELDRVAQQLEEEGVRKFAEPFDELQRWLEEQRQ
ncbi:MAG TPA: transaldolase [Steroidobacteraceae bacterium]|nr:transaldolase [Steroidobacteraceae bacterium]